MGLRQVLDVRELLLQSIMLFFLLSHHWVWRSSGSLLDRRFTSLFGVVFCVFKILNELKGTFLNDVDCFNEFSFFKDHLIALEFNFAHRTHKCNHFTFGHILKCGVRLKKTDLISLHLITEVSKRRLVPLSSE